MVNGEKDTGPHNQGRVIAVSILSQVQAFYRQHLPGARMENYRLQAPCPFCKPGDGEHPGTLVVDLNPESLFHGHFRCLNRCTHGGFPLYFGRLAGIEPSRIPGFDPDREPFASPVVYPVKNINAEVRKYASLMDVKAAAHFAEWGISLPTLRQLQIGFNGRYVVYPYTMEDGNCYAARCELPGREEDFFWHGDGAFFEDSFQIFNLPAIERCENGALFITEEEKNLLALKELGYPGIAVPAAPALEAVWPERLACLKHVLLVMRHAPESQLMARALATRLGFKARIYRWPAHFPKGYSLCHLAREAGKRFAAKVAVVVKHSQAFSPFSSPAREFIRYQERLVQEQGSTLLGMPSGFSRLDDALSGIRGINILGGPPKSGKSCLFMQISTQMAQAGIPVIYYDFENGRQKIYTRTLCRLSGLAEQAFRRQIAQNPLPETLRKVQSAFRHLLHNFRVVTDRRLTPDLMRRHIDFLRHETGQPHTLVVVDSLHKLPFKDLSERRTGIDAWLRQMEAIRDEEGSAFMVISEMSRGAGGHYNDRPGLGSFKESGDIEYSADNAMLLLPAWDPLEPVSEKERQNRLWVVASRENNPGHIADYVLEYPFWRFREIPPCSNSR